MIDPKTHRGAKHIFMTSSVVEHKLAEDVWLWLASSDFKEVKRAFALAHAIYADGNISLASRRMRVNRTTVYAWLKEKTMEAEELARVYNLMREKLTDERYLISIHKTRAIKPWHQTAKKEES